MSDTDKPVDQIAMQSFIRDLCRVSEHTHPVTLAVQASVQARCTQEVVQMFVDLMIEKNLFSDMDFRRRLAARYDRAREELNANNMLVRPGGVTVKPK